ncbi:MAG: hypothetical protein M0R75_11550 [Dehalococcoidia bacterium]|nr:hypothetical protein [Dehalococcoidia bacterium]
MSIRNTIGEMRSFAKVIDFSDLANKAAFGAQDPVTIHDILPEGWRIYDVEVETLVAFNGSGTRVLDLGVTGAAEAIFADLDVKAAALKNPTVTKYRAAGPNLGIIATLTTATDQPTAGKVSIEILAYPAVREEEV